MDSLRAFEDQDWSTPADDEPVIERPPNIGFDERRMHVRAYNYWVSLLNGRAYPSIHDVQPQDLGDFGPHSVLLDFGLDAEDPDVAFLGHALSIEIGLGADVERISQVPPRSLLSRLTDHYLQILANRAPIGFEAEFVNHRGNATLYRGILMPLSTDGDTIDFVYGVINWKELADNQAAQSLAGAVEDAINAAGESARRADLPAWADGPHSEPEPESEKAARAPAIHADGPMLSLWPEAGPDEAAADEAEADLAPLDADAGLWDHLELARQGAELARESDLRSRAALYRALGLAYDFALVAEARPDDYAELLDDSGLKAQARAPMTPIVKLVFGIDYDKGRLTEFATALAYARRQDVAAGGFQALIEGTAGGLKGLVAAERALRRPPPTDDKGAAVRARIATAPALAQVEGLADGIDAGQIVLLVGRTDADGKVSIITPAVVDERFVTGLFARLTR